MPTPLCTECGRSWEHMFLTDAGLCNRCACEQRHRELHLCKSCGKGEPEVAFCEGHYWTCTTCLRSHEYAVWARQQRKEHEQARDDEHWTTREADLPRLRI